MSGTNDFSNDARLLREQAAASANRQCSEFAQPAAYLGPHVAALGMRFYTGTMFPEAYRNQINAEWVASRGAVDNGGADQEIWRKQRGRFLMARQQLAKGLCGRTEASGEKRCQAAAFGCRHKRVVLCKVGVAQAVFNGAGRAGR